MVAFKVGTDKLSDFGDTEDRAERCAYRLYVGVRQKMHSSVQDGC